MRLVKITLWALAAQCFTQIAFAQDRLPTIPKDQYTPEQAQAAQEFLKARKVEPFGPFEPLMHSPEMMSNARSMGDHLRYHSAIGNTLSEFTILLVAREWSQDYEWYVHAPFALKAGVKKDVVEAIREGRLPSNLSEDESMIYAFATEVLHNKQVSDVTYGKVEARFGKKGVVDLTGILGYYTLLGMEMNVARYALPPDGKKLPRLPD